MQNPSHDRLEFRFPSTNIFRGRGVRFTSPFPARAVRISVKSARLLTHGGKDKKRVEANRILVSPCGSVLSTAAGVGGGRCPCMREIPAAPSLFFRARGGPGHQRLVSGHGFASGRMDPRLNSVVIVFEVIALKIFNGPSGNSRGRASPRSGNCLLGEDVKVETGVLDTIFFDGGLSMVSAGFLLHSRKRAGQREGGHRRRICKAELGDPRHRSTRPPRHPSRGSTGRDGDSVAGNRRPALVFRGSNQPHVGVLMSRPAE